MNLPVIFRGNLVFLSISKRVASNVSEGHVEYFRELNRLTSSGAWDQLNMRPKIFSTKAEKTAATKIWQKFIPEDADWFERRPGGLFIRSFLYVLLLCGTAYMIPYSFEKLVPEEYRCKIKYRKNDGHY